MYKQYLNDYEKRAEQIRKAARAVEGGGSFIEQTVPQAKNPEERHIKKKSQGVFAGLERFSTDDILLLGILFLLITNEEKDMTLIIVLGYLFLSGL